MENILLQLRLPLLPKNLAFDEVLNPLNQTNGKYFGTIEVNNLSWNLQYDSETDLWWVNPRPNAEFYKILYTKLFYSSPLPEQFGYATLETDGERRTAKALKNWEDIEKNAEILSKNSLLEIGCGSGEFLISAKNNGWETVVGNELEKSSAEIALSKGLKIDTGFFENMQSKQKFDMIFADNVIEHTMNPLDFLQKCFELTEKNGLVVLRLPDTQPFGPTLKLIDHTFHFSRKSIRLFAEKAGFKVENIFYSGTYKGTKYDLDNMQRIENMTVIARKIV
ncbi:MAG: class I SAM-dependent methyltransferase [Bacteroidetes bacterium]|nr:MAG: class I SAM-dependent methyltransferase [Bacteroidota bacterium]